MHTFQKLLCQSEITFNFTFQDYLEAFASLEHTRGCASCRNTPKTKN